MSDKNKIPPEGEESKNVPPEGQDTVSLSKYSQTKGVLARTVDMLTSNEDALAELTQSDPKLVENLKKEFPNRFKDVAVKPQALNTDDFEKAVERSVNKVVASQERKAAMKSLQKKLGLKAVEFEDIATEINAKADKLVNAEIAKDYEDAVNKAYSLIDPAKAAEIAEKAAADNIVERLQGSKGSGGQGQKTKTDTEEQEIAKKFSKNLPPGFTDKDSEDV